MLNVCQWRLLLLVLRRVVESFLVNGCERVVERCGLELREDGGFHVIAFPCLLHLEVLHINFKLDVCAWLLLLLVLRRMVESLSIKKILGEVRRAEIAEVLRVRYGVEPDGPVVRLRRFVLDHAGERRGAGTILRCQRVGLDHTGVIGSGEGKTWGRLGSLQARLRLQVCRGV
eukprot:814540-Rhodomonas_salina.1